MKYRFRQETKTIAEIYKDFREKNLIVDRSYQRRTVWADKDKVRLIETILLDFVVPEVYFWDSERNVDTGIPITHIVDGQQRICTIIDFLQGKFSLNTKYLTDKTIIDNYGNMSFINLPKDIIRKIWEYPLSVILIDSDCSIEEIKKIFYRLNMTDYSLNSQERMKSIGSAFGEKSEALSNFEFWNTVNVFSTLDVKRMKDVYYCGCIYILADTGIIGQTTTEEVEDYYKDYADTFDEDDALLEKIKRAMEMILQVRCSGNSAFISKKIQLYTLFSVFFEMIDKGNEITETFQKNFNAFVQAYKKFRNDIVIDLEEGEIMSLYDQIKRYKLASSEGVNKLQNRVIRCEILKKVCGSEDMKCADYLLLIAERFKAAKETKTNEKKEI